jgi:hypothetical protein
VSLAEKQPHPLRSAYDNLLLTAHQRIKRASTGGAA